jgi:DNA-binding LacI/PurR family transcriptional regulator
MLSGPAEERPTAIIAQSDLLAAGVIRGAEELGIKVPEELSVIGFDGVRVDGLWPYELTTLEQPAYEKGRAAGRAIVRMLEGREAESVSFTSVLRVGNTTAAPPPAS